jgi:hypothetical protein
VNPCTARHASQIAHVAASRLLRITFLLLMGYQLDGTCVIRTVNCRMDAVSWLGCLITVSGVGGFLKITRHEGVILFVT